MTSSALNIREDMTVDSVTVAERCGVQHKNALELLKTHGVKLESRFGPIAFETRKGEPLPHGGFAKGTRIAHLTEDQATAFITLFQNTEKVVDFKFTLVAAFAAAKRRIASTEPTQEQIDRYLSNRYFAHTHPACEYGSAAGDGRKRTGWRRPTFTVSRGQEVAAREVAAALLVMQEYLPGFRVQLAEGAK